MLAAIRTTTLSRRSCALTGSAITSRSRRNSTRGPPSAPRIARSLFSRSPGRGSLIARSCTNGDRGSGTHSRDFLQAIANAPCKGQAKAANLSGKQGRPFEPRRAGRSAVGRQVVGERRALILPQALLVAQFGRNTPAGIDAGHIWQLMRDALVAVDAGALPRQQEPGMDLGGASCLLRQVHGDGGMAVAAFERVVRLEPRPFVLGEFEALVEEFLPRRDRAEDLAPDFLRRLHLARDLDRPLVGHVTVGAARAHAGSVGKMDRLLQLLINIVVH